jgi:hypothetical protein
VWRPDVSCAGQWINAVPVRVQERCDESLTVLVRAIVRAIDAGSFTQSVGPGLLFASLPFVLPRPKVKLEASALIKSKP